MSTDKMKVAVNKQKVIATLIGIGLVIIAIVAFIIEENIRGRPDATLSPPPC